MGIALDYIDGAKTHVNLSSHHPIIPEDTVFLIPIPSPEYDSPTHHFVAFLAQSLSFFFFFLFTSLLFSRAPGEGGFLTPPVIFLTPPVMNYFPPDQLTHSDPLFRGTFLSPIRTGKNQNRTSES